MNLEQIRARLGEISAKLKEYSAMENHTDATISDMETLTSEYSALERKYKVLDAAAKAANAPSAGRQTTPVAQPQQPAAQTQPDNKFMGFQSTGDYLMAVKEAGRGKIHENLQNAAYTSSAEDGGYLIPEEISTSIQKKLEANESLLSRTRQFAISGNSLAMPIDETQPWNSGIKAFWVGEGEKLTETKAKFKQHRWHLHKVGALCVLSDEMMEDAKAMESYIKQFAGEAISHKINEAIIKGDGVEKPKGFMNSPFTVTVLKESGQAADTVVARNVINMYARMIPQARAGAFWICNAAVEPQLLTMKDDNDNFIYLAPGSQLNQSPYGLLMGRPVIPMLSVLPALGDSGDIMFINLSYYFVVTKTGGGVKSASSIHMYFDRELTAFRFTMRIDGSVPFQAPVTTEFGDYKMSAFVKLEDRA